MSALGYYIPTRVIPKVIPELCRILDMQCTLQASFKIAGLETVNEHQHQLLVLGDAENKDRSIEL